MKINSESLPSRCEICHQTDLFDPVTGHCQRCAGLHPPAISVQRIEIDERTRQGLSCPGVSHIPGPGERVPITREMWRVLNMWGTKLVGPPPEPERTYMRRFAQVLQWVSDLLFLEIMFCRYRWYRVLHGGRWVCYWIDAPVCAEVWRQWEADVDGQGRRYPLERGTPVIEEY